MSPSTDLLVGKGVCHSFTRFEECQDFSCSISPSIESIPLWSEPLTTPGPSTEPARRGQCTIASSRPLGTSLVVYVHASVSLGRITASLGGRSDAAPRQPTGSDDGVKGLCGASLNAERCDDGCGHVHRGSDEVVMGWWMWLGVALFSQSFFSDRWFSNARAYYFENVGSVVGMLGRSISVLFSSPPRSAEPRETRDRVVQPPAPFISVPEYTRSLNHWWSGLALHHGIIPASRGVASRHNAGVVAVSQRGKKR